MNGSVKNGDCSKLMNILVTLDSNYTAPFRVMLTSLFLNNPGESFHVHVIYSHITDDEITSITEFCKQHGSDLSSVCVLKVCLLMPLFSVTTPRRCIIGFWLMNSCLPI